MRCIHLKCIVDENFKSQNIVIRIKGREIEGRAKISGFKVSRVMRDTKGKPMSRMAERETIWHLS